MKKFLMALIAVGFLLGFVSTISALPLPGDYDLGALGEIGFWRETYVSGGGPGDPGARLTGQDFQNSPTAPSSSIWNLWALDLVSIEKSWNNLDMDGTGTMVYQTRYAQVGLGAVRLYNRDTSPWYNNSDPLDSLYYVTICDALVMTTVSFEEGEKTGLEFDVALKGFFNLDPTSLLMVTAHGIEGLDLADRHEGQLRNIVANISPVPEPATMVLLGSGLIGLAGLGRKKFFKKKS